MRQQLQRYSQYQEWRWGTSVLIAALGTVFLAFLLLSLSITAAGTARFATAMGYPTKVGFIVGSVFDLAKALLPVALLMLLSRRAYLFFAIIGTAWLGLVAYSCLATHATVTSAIAAIERTGTWKMEGRANATAELAGVEERMSALSQPQVPRPSATVRAALLSERVPSGVWRDSQECQRIRQSKYFQGACAKVLELRRELAAAEDYERLNVRASELRQVLASSPILATSDPLPEAFAATLGQFLKLEGRVGVAMLLTFVIEIMSCFGFAALRALREEQGREAASREEGSSRREFDQGCPTGKADREPPTAGETFPACSPQNVPQASEGPGSSDGRPASKGTSREEVDPPSNVIPIAKERGREPLPPKGSLGGVAATKPDAISAGAQVAEFVRTRLHSATGESLGAAQLRTAYEAWCDANGHAPVSQQKFGAQMSDLGFVRWKSCGLIRYRDVRLAA